MLPDTLPHLIETLLRLSYLDEAQLREQIQHLPDPQGSAQEMLHRGWITQDQFSSLFPGPQQPPTPRETTPLDFGDDESSPDADDVDWSVAPIVEEDTADLPSEVEWVRTARTDEEMRHRLATVKAVLLPFVADGNEVRWRESDTDKHGRKGKGWARKGLLTVAVCLGSFVVGLLFFWSKTPVPPVARRESREVIVADPVRVVVVPDLTQLVQNQFAKVQEALTNGTGPNVKPAAPAAAKAPVAVQSPARTNDAKADGPRSPSPPVTIAPPSDANPFRVGQDVSVQWGGRWWNAKVLKAENGQYYVNYDGYSSAFDEWVGPERIRRR
jgi:hypothetical protein